MVYRISYSDQLLLAKAMADLTIDSLMEFYGLTKMDYNEAISDKHLVEISESHCSRWEPLNPYLGMKRIIGDDINCGTGSEAEKRLNFFLKWKRVKGSAATYRTLLSALLAIDCREDAKSVCEMLISSSQEVRCCIACMVV